MARLEASRDCHCSAETWPETSTEIRHVSLRRLVLQGLAQFLILHGRSTEASAVWMLLRGQSLLTT